MSLVVKDLTHVYMPGTPYQHVALDNVSLTINDGEFAAIIGHTGSGKSTLVQHFNGLIKATSGSIIVNGIDITQKDADMKQARRMVGLVFQYPEYQLFEETIYKDIAFGPRNLKLSEEEIDERVREACALVNLDFETMKEKSPFELSGGQKRRVAIAGVLAMRPDILILDEPTAGLDPRGRDEILALIEAWHKSGKTIIMVSHSMDDVAKYADHIIAFKSGKIAVEGSAQEVFMEPDKLIEIGLDVPKSVKLSHMFMEKGINTGLCYTAQQLKDSLKKILGGGMNAG
ncbi:MAG: energy-coupling factor transporter ATPase [Clostridia bacterium]|nr:energy-coupling factor transporter ATPase [Clostridia bacterium]MBQ4637388.1 energy-coupling factor transporter ATPase [Clostridia bacterium]